MSLKINAQLFWINDAVTLNTTFEPNNKKFKLTVCNVSPKAAERLTSDFGIKVKSRADKPEYGLHFSAKSFYAWEFKDDAGNVVNASDIGNGTKAVIVVSGSYVHQLSKLHGSGAIIESKNGVVITELVAREAKTSEEEAEAL